MNQKIKALAILPLAASLTFFGIQAVTFSVAATTGVGETPATTGATAETIEDCEWYLNGVAEVLSLTNDSGMEYVGDDYTLSESDTAVNVYFSGTEAEDDRCSFYDDVRGAGVDVSWTGDSFSNVDAGDTSLDWNLGDELDAVDSGSDHAVDGVAAGTTDTDHADQCFIAVDRGELAGHVCSFVSRHTGRAQAGDEVCSPPALTVDPTSPGWGPVRLRGRAGVGERQGVSRTGPAVNGGLPRGNTAPSAWAS